MGRTMVHPMWGVSITCIDADGDGHRYAHGGTLIIRVEMCDMCGSELESCEICGRYIECCPCGAHHAVECPWPL